MTILKKNKNKQIKQIKKIKKTHKKKKSKLMIFMNNNFLIQSQTIIKSSQKIIKKWFKNK